MRLANKVAIITGGSRGIGQAIALSFAHEGARVAIVGRNKILCDQTVTQILKNDGSAISIQADVSSEDEVAQMVQTLKDYLGGGEILVNNATINLLYITIAKLTLKKWNSVITINTNGTFLCCLAVLPKAIT